MKRKYDRQKAYLCRLGQRLQEAASDDLRNWATQTSPLTTTQMAQALSEKATGDETLVL